VVVVVDVKSKLDDLTNVRDCTGDNGLALFNDWEREFISDVAEHFAAHHSVTRKQEAVIESLWERV
jgi:hypothetical protein